MPVLRRLLILSHRYLGIVLALVVIMWFATGITMMYAGGMPRLTPQMRLDRLAAVDLERVQLTPEQAAERAGRDGRASLVMLMDRPVYRFAGREPVTVFADTGELLDGMSAGQARRVASHFLGVPDEQIHHVRTLTDIDQWTLVQSVQMPLHKFRVDDEDATELYIQAATGEPVMLTTRRTRALAWISTIPHWFYFTALRANQPLWYDVVVWTSGAATMLAVLGLALAFTQWRRTRPFQLSKAIPYAGPMRWHYITGAVFGIFTVTFAFSGLLSMEPFEWTNARGIEVPRDTMTGGAPDLSQFGPMDPALWPRVTSGRAIKEVEFTRIQDEHYYTVRVTPTDEAKKRERLHQPYYITGAAEPDRLIVHASTLQVRDQPFSAGSLVGRLEAALPGAPIVESQVLSEYDSYYYSKRRQTPLPVLRVKFADPAETWVYVDPETSQVLAAIPRLARVERWLYNGLHSLDFAFWYTTPAWDVGMIVLCFGGLTTSTLGLMMGVRRLRRGARRAAKAVAPDADVTAGLHDKTRPTTT